ncbi:MAG: Electron transport complex, RnfABCDGE type, subunit [Rhodocyclaceae bacterium]|nr:Electron transport complex, RnfABCDGE type, subunit [Rhodocyclaceae bacterium]
MIAAKEPTAPGMAARTAAILFLFVVAFTAALAIVYVATKPGIDAAAAEEKMRAINEVLPKDLYDNDLLADTLKIPATPELGLDDESTIYRARLGGEPSALVLETVAPDGYAGKIRMLVAVRANGELAGVRVTQHKETPGLGDYIEPKKDKNKERPWITQFNGLSLDKVPASGWKVKKDGGRFDFVAGATVTPRAMVKAVHKTLQYAVANRDRLFATK